MNKLILIALGLFFLGQESARVNAEQRRSCNRESQCLRGETCVKDINGLGPFCFKTCMVSTDCPEKHYCSPNGNVCRTHCIQNSDCPSGKNCVGEEKNKICQ
jgi:hypothetical protein